MKKIKDTSKILPKISAEKVAKALGAELVPTPKNFTQRDMTNFYRMRQEAVRNIKELPKRTKVRMSPKLKDGMMKNGSHEHVEEFGECIGIVKGLIDYGTQQGPEVEVYWQPSNLHYAYHPKYLEIVDDE